MESKPYHCEECGSPFMATTNGSVCPNGHGKMHPKMPRRVATLNAARIALGVENVRPLSNGSYELPSKEGKFRKTPGTRCITRLLTEWPSELGEGEVLGIDGDRIIRLTPEKQLTAS